MERGFTEEATVEHRPPNDTARMTDAESQSISGAEPWWHSRLVITVLGTLAAAVVPATTAIHGNFTRTREIELANRQRHKELGLADAQKAKEIELAREEKANALAAAEQQHSHLVLIDLLDRVIDPDLDPEIRQTLLRFLEQYQGAPFQQWAKNELALVKPAVDKIVRLRSEVQAKDDSVRKTSDDVQAKRDEVRVQRASRNPRVRAKARKAQAELASLVQKQKIAQAEARRLQVQFTSAKNPAGIIGRIRKPLGVKIKSAVKGPLSVLRP